MARQPPCSTLNLDPTDLEATARAFPDALTPPGRLFFDAAVYTYDMEQVFGRMWLCAAHVSQINEPGRFITLNVGNEPLLIVRNRTGQLNAFFNVCRHRGTRVTETKDGTARGFTCPYHAWHYDLDGMLKAAPLMDDVDGFSRDAYPLVRAQVDEFMGFVFINLDENAAPLDEQFKGFPDLSRYSFHDLQRVATHEYDVESNWKLICQNYHECYHCRVAHPDLHRISHYGALENVESSGHSFFGGPMALRDGYNTLTKSGITVRDALPGATAEDRQRVHYYHLLPNFLLSIAPDYVLTHHLWPLGPERVFIESSWLFSAEQIAQGSFDPSDAVDFWDTTNRQDWMLCENALKGLKSSRHRPGRYQSSEDCAHRFDQWYAQTLLSE